MEVLRSSIKCLVRSYNQDGVTRKNRLLRLNICLESRSCHIYMYIHSCIFNYIREFLQVTQTNLVHAAIGCLLHLPLFDVIKASNNKHFIISHICYCPRWHTCRPTKICSPDPLFEKMINRRVGSNKTSSKGLLAAIISYVEISQ